MWNYPPLSKISSTFLNISQLYLTFINIPQLVPNSLNFSKPSTFFNFLNFPQLFPDFHRPDQDLSTHTLTIWVLHSCTLSSSKKWQFQTVSHHEGTLYCSIQYADDHWPGTFCQILPLQLPFSLATKDTVASIGNLSDKWQKVKLHESL